MIYRTEEEVQKQTDKERIQCFLDFVCDLAKNVFYLKYLPTFTI